MSRSASACSAWPIQRIGTPRTAVTPGVAASDRSARSTDAGSTALGLALELDRREAEKNGTASTRRACRGGRDVLAYEWYAEYELQCGDHVEVIRERSLADPSKDKINRSENVRQVPPGTSAYQELYPHRSSIEGFNSWVDGRSWLRRARCRGAACQQLEQLEQLGMACLYNALVRRTNQHQLTAPDALPDAA
jgi:hypothetical protein